MESNYEAGNVYSFISEQEVSNIGIYANQLMQEQRFQEELNEEKEKFDKTFGERIELCKRLFRTGRLYQYMRDVSAGLVGQQVQVECLLVDFQDNL